ncbi:MAG TPA: SOS response-associated peptidase [Gammaproteobacteria bacterium]|nr:SOS response-associated peptidase [Gammaproteobacteria bacterium]
MCGRYALKTSVPEIARILGASATVEFAPSYNVAPSRKVPVCRVSAEGDRELALLRWGLVPHWAKQVNDRYRMINARAETVEKKPAFRTPFRRRRCLVPADGYFEWKAGPQRKQPYFIHRKDGAPLFLAGLWDRWEKDDDGPLDSFSIVTTSASSHLAAVHDRMPVIIQEADRQAWLDPAVENSDLLLPLLKPDAGTELSLTPVSTYVNNPRNDDPRCLEPVTAPSAG